VAPAPVPESEEAAKMAKTEGADAPEASLSVSTIAAGPVRRTLEIEVDAKRVRHAFDRAYRNLARSVRVRGFRPGKAPRAVLEKLYGASLAEEIERVLVSETLPEAVSQSGLAPVSEPSVDAVPPDPDGPFRYTASVEVKPEIALPELSGLPARRPVVLVPEDDVDRELEALRERRAPLEDEPEGTPASGGAILTLDYAGTIDGTPFEGGSAEGATVELGAGRLVPGFEEQLEGATAGSEREIRVTFSEDYPSADVAGREAVFAVRVRQVKRRELPALDDDFARSVGEFESLAALRERIAQDLREGRERAAQQETRRSLLDALLERTPFEVPPGMVERRLVQRLAAAHQQLGSVMPEHELHERLAQWREQWRPLAEREVREALVLEAVAAQQGLEVAPEEVDARLEQMAREQGVDPARLRRAHEERGLTAALAAQMREEQALEFLLSEAKVEELTAT
jgi:trigger factor